MLIKDNSVIIGLITQDGGIILKWDSYVKRYTDGEWRATIFRDLILNEVERMEKDKLSVLDIGCGGGFDHDMKIQKSIALGVDKYIGVEPDSEIKLNDFFSVVHRTYFEDAPIEKESIDIAFAVMVLEHFSNPQVFWNKIYDILNEGGVFWGFTVDARHPFKHLSVLTEKFRIKDFYLNMLRGERGEQRYENYGTYYKSNTPKQIYAATRKFARKDFLNFNRIGQMDYYFPISLRWVGRTIDYMTLKLGIPGSILAIRVEK
ncbi:MAG: methyltransferase domain-containing protein [Pseudomonadota bacterium]